ncbi:MAG: sugar transferase [Alphaproteobacteria bacterium]|nr:sugar transferase [Alphaproteobacteria bacterium]
MVKRTFDVFCVCCALLVLGLPLAVVAVALRLTGEGEIFYGQERIGRGGRPFRILKFATMLKNSPHLSGGDITVKGDPRILPVGRFLRKTKINELPQLFNVLLGDMSLIGYRPLTPRVAALFPQGYWSELSDIRPGLSGIGSIVFRDEERLLSASSDRERLYSEVIVPYKAALELWYARHQSFWLDLKLIALTVVAILKPNMVADRWFSDLPQAPSAVRNRIPQHQH